VDNNNDRGLEQSTDYCYRVVAYFEDGAESYASAEACTRLVRGIPLITKVEVKSTDPGSGSINIAWLKPRPEQMEGYNGPFGYKLYRNEGMFAQNKILVDSLLNLEDTTFTDRNRNTQGQQWAYTIELWNREPGRWERIGEPQMATSLFLDLLPHHKSLKLTWKKNVPWTNDRYVIYRQSVSGEDSIGISTGNDFVDRGLSEGVSYCYRIKSQGGYHDLGIEGLESYSQIRCAIPVDSVAPCPPILIVHSVCDSLANFLKWNNVNDSCSEDAAFYRIYYRVTLEGEMIRIDSVSPADRTTYWHYPDKTMAGCYAVTAVDSVGNESEYSNIVCVDDCINYSLPNVFTPNGDGINDFLKPNPYNRVEKINLSIFSRWNTIVYQTEDPEINWDGKHMRNGRTVPAGVYYYVCEVYEQRLTGTVPRYLTGFIHILYSDKAQVDR
jgi:gliding motility-associated-like protein